MKTVAYKYDSAGRRLLKWVDSGQRTRYFFNGLTEEIRKVSVGTYGGGNFAFDDGETASRRTSGRRPRAA